MKLDEGTSGFDPLGLSGGERRRRAGKGALEAMKVGIHHQQDPPPPSTAATSKGSWDYWKYRVLLLGVALLWGTNFPAVCMFTAEGNRVSCQSSFFFDGLDSDLNLARRMALDLFDQKEQRAGHI